MHTVDPGDSKDCHMTRDHASDAITDLPPSAKLVVKVLEYNDTLTQYQIAEESFSLTAQFGTR